MAILYRCRTCGNTFHSYNPNPQYCSRSCKAEAQIAQVDVERLRELYASGMTQAEVAAELKTTQKVIHNAMKRNGIPARTAAKRNQWGAANHMWKGDEAGYQAFHIRLSKRYGRLNHCDVCGTTDKSAWYDWANLTGQYQDINDYKRMCRSCHRQYDAARREEVMPNDAANTSRPV